MLVTIQKMFQLASYLSLLVAANGNEKERRNTQNR